MKELLTQFYRYFIVGGIAFVVDYGTLFFLTDVLSVYYLVSAAISFSIGLICNYFLSRLWVFGESKVNNGWVEFAVFAIIGIVGLGINELIIYVFSDVLSIHYMLGKIVSTVIVFCWNFLARRFILYKS